MIARHYITTIRLLENADNTAAPAIHRTGESLWVRLLQQTQHAS